MAIIIPDWAIYVVIVLWAFGKVITRFGGTKIAYFRARGIPFFSYVLKNPNHDRKTYTRKSSALTFNSPLGFEHDGNGGIYFWPTVEVLPPGAKTEDYIDRWYGGPLLEFREGDSRPMPISKADGQLMTPTVLMKPYKNKSSADLNRIGQKTARIEKLARFLQFVEIIALAVIIYYELVYGQSIACAVHAHGFNCT